MNDFFASVLDEFKAKEAPEAVLAVGDDENLIKIVLAWPNIPICRGEAEPEFSADCSDIDKWNWLWQCVQYRKWDLENAAGATRNLDKNVKMLIANRILYPDGTVHSFVTKYLRDRVVKLFETKPRARRSKTNTS